MKNILKYLGIMSLIISFTSTAFSQQGGGRGGFNMEPKEFAERQTKQMKDSLGLAADQLPKVEALNLKYAEKMSAARKEADGDREAMRATMREMIGEKDKELKEILTAEQWTKFEADRKERMQNRRGGGGRRGI